ncbi:MAG: peptide ABC transporter substrate-binding protein, partial [Caulobacteraceae bacterium]|nr:peptide ABC transporter substrate-binding protein [Caulobacter sp.]
MALALPACRRRETPVEIGNREGIIHLGNGAEPRDLDPHTATSVTEANILSALFEGLVIFAPDGKTILPGAAERWDVSADGKTYTFHLRAGLKWSNGDALTSQDFLYSFRRLVEPKLAAEFAVYANWIAGAQDFNEGKTTDPATVGFRAPDPQTFEVTLKERAPFVLALLAQNPFYPVHRPTIEKFDAYARRGSDWTRPGNLVGNGPFVLKDWRVNDALTVARNPSYWNAANVRLQAAVFHPIDDAGAEERAFRGGLLHVTRYLPAARLEAYRREHSPLLHADELVSTKFVELNTAAPVFRDVRVRQEFAGALDREAIVRDVRRDGSRVADSLCVPGSGPSPGYAPRVRLVHAAPPPAA